MVSIENTALPPLSASGPLLTSTSKTPRESVLACWNRLRVNSPVYTFFFDDAAADLGIISAEHGRVVARMTVHANILNSKGGLHGSTSATIVDWAGGLAIASTGLEKTGVSTDIHVSYVSSARLGDVLIIEGKVSRVGKNMGFTTVTIWKEKGKGRENEVVAHGTHTKYILRDQTVAAATPDVSTSVGATGAIGLASTSLT